MILGIKKEVKGYALIFGYLGIFITMIGVITLLPLLILPFYPQEINYLLPFLITGVSVISVGLILYFLLLFNKTKGRLNKHHDSILLLLVWLLAILISAIPLAAAHSANYLQAIFEMTSGYTTTGASVMVRGLGIELPSILILHRTITQFAGGVGLFLIVTSVVSTSNGVRLYSVEGHGDQLLPNLLKSARLVLLLYLCYVLLGAGAFILSGIPILDAFCLSVTCITTGGFTANSGGMAGYNNLPAEIIAMVLMVLGATNLFIHFFLIQRKFKNVIKDNETVVMLGTGFFVIFLLALVLTPTINALYFSFDYAASLANSIHHYGDALRYTSFQVISAMTTTGLQTISDLAIIPGAFTTVLVILMFIGGSSGSTAGGIKTFRLVIAIKGAYFQIRQSFRPKNTISTMFYKKHGQEVEITPQLLSSNYAYILIYFVVTVLGVLFLSIANPGAQFGESAFAIVSLQSSTGFASRLFTADSNAFTLVVGILVMLIGRLEAGVIITAFNRSGKDLVHHIKDLNAKRISEQNLPQE